MNNNLAKFASNPSLTRGRLYSEIEPKERSNFQRDRDRVIHCEAFRKLMYKTQVFISHEGDLFRTRLTHSIEVAQVARAISRRLMLNEDLTEAICLAHDLGHTPFGHAGQNALNKSLRNLDKKSCGFEHNIQSLRIVDNLEQRYLNFDGLNLCFETREGILKHCSKVAAPKLGKVAERFLKGGLPSLEAQLANIADEIAYNHHDLDDGLRSGLLNFEEVSNLSAASEHIKEIKSCFGDKEKNRRNSEIVRRMINSQIEDLIETTRQNIRETPVLTVEDVRMTSKNLVTFSYEMQKRVKELKSFLFKKLYKHPVVSSMSDLAEVVISDLFEIFLEELNNGRTKVKLRKIADLIAGMTDRSAIKIHTKYFPNKISWPQQIYFS